MTITTVIEAISGGLVKVFRYGRNDVNTPEVVLPYGIDSKPIKNKRGLVSKTSNNGTNAIIGYFLKSQNTEAGEIRVYCTDNNSEEKFYIHLKKDGSCEIGGSVDNLVRYNGLDLGIQQQAVDINTELGKISAAIVALGGAYAVAPIAPDISGSKIDEIKTL